MCSCLESGVAFPGLSARSVTRVGSYERLGSRCDAFEFDRTRSRYDRRTDDRNNRNDRNDRDDHDDRATDDDPEDGEPTPVGRWSGHAAYRSADTSSGAEAESTEAGESGLKVVAFHGEKSRVCWLAAMRLAKYGKQLRENYRAFKNKQCEQSNGDGSKERYGNHDASNESVRSRVAMDFTGSVGRIVEDPKEAKDIAESEGIDWRRSWRPFSRAPPGCAVVRLHGLDEGIHALQPWFHRRLKRDVAAAIVRDHGSVDGAFLVRESKSNSGAYVLTYKFSDKVFHAQIQPVFDERCNCWLYTLDKGATKFYDLLQLVEFYQLNAGSLPTRLTRYVQNGVPMPVPRSEDGGASPSPPEPCHRFTVNEPAEIANPTTRETVRG
ncbi:growth factor receptor-bound protein 14 isoform X5 [Ptiloglossa arizonensis]